MHDYSFGILFCCLYLSVYTVFILRVAPLINIPYLSKNSRHTSNADLRPLCCLFVLFCCTFVAVCCFCLVVLLYCLFLSSSFFALFGVSAAPRRPSAPLASPFFSPFFSFFFYQTLQHRTMLWILRTNETRGHDMCRLFFFFQWWHENPRFLPKKNVSSVDDVSLWI